MQLIQELTHITDQTMSLLDFIIIDSPGYIIKSGLLETIGDLYHITIFYEFQVQYTKSKYTRETWHYHNCNVEQLTDTIELSEILHGL